jgi:hypothetical protein
MKKQFYKVEQILDKKIMRGKVHYKILWEGYPESDASW